MAARHIDRMELVELDQLAQRFFALARAAGSYYGRGDFVHSPEPNAEHPFAANRFEHKIWSDCARRSEPLVPGIHYYNLLTTDRLQRLGGREGILDAWQSHTPKPTIGYDLVLDQCAGDSLVVRFKRVTPSQLEGLDGVMPNSGDETMRLAFLARLAQADMLAIQNLKWACSVQNPGATGVEVRANSTA